MQLLYDENHHKPNERTNDELRESLCKYGTKAIVLQIQRMKHFKKKKK